METPKWTWTMKDDPTIQPDIYPPYGSQWQKKGSKRIEDKDCGFHRQQIMDPQGIMEDKQRRDTWQELIRAGISTEKAFIENLQAREKVLSAEKAQKAGPRKDDLEAIHKNSSSPTESSSKPLKRKAEQDNSAQSANSQTASKVSRVNESCSTADQMDTDAKEGEQGGSEKTKDENDEGCKGSMDKGKRDEEEEGTGEGQKDKAREQTPVEEDDKMSQDSKGENTDQLDEQLGEDEEGGSENSLEWLNDYVRKLEREREVEFEVRVAHKRHLLNLQNVNFNQSDSSIQIPTQNQFEILEKEHELSDFFAERYGQRLDQRGNNDHSEQYPFKWPKTYTKSEGIHPSKKSKGAKRNEQRNPPSPTQMEGREGEDILLNTREDLDRQKEILHAQITVLRDPNRETADDTINLQGLAQGQNAEILTAARLEAKGGCRKKIVIPYHWNEEHQDWEIAVVRSWSLLALSSPSNKVLAANISKDAPEAAHILGSKEEWREEWLDDAGDILAIDLRPYMVRYSMEAQLMDHMAWKPWKVLHAIPYGLMGGEIPAERVVVSASLVEGHFLFDGRKDHREQVLETNARQVKIRLAPYNESPFN
ncbi:hypothetical protein CBR_g52138 [Chara braunii]|uniref:Uncharacterized protein n=1 Tax=Chara braunii TaxID=69332 RepID=A0A388M9V9_CHABU|nr:hypothetical protein CBR_g52138 [Chara braunii]|eukprot:GBG91252.1 hypothetical protein CBR_g52138 [Chara braunii]